MRGIAKYFGTITPVFDESLHHFMIGSKLGDGSFIQRTALHNTYVSFKHSVSQYEYLCWKHAFLRKRGIVKDNDIKKQNFGENRKDTWEDQYRFVTATFKEFNIYNEMSISDLLRNMSELSFAIWVLDDGNICSRSIKISCARFTDEEREIASERITSLFGINNSPYHYDKNGMIYIGADGFSVVQKIVERNISSTLDIVRKKFSLESNSLQLLVKYHSDDYVPLSYIEGKSDWIDLRADEDVEFNKGDFKLISLGVSIKMPDGYEGYLVPRSSTFKNYGLLQANGIGIVDSSYCGDNDIWRFPAFATRPSVVKKGDRIAQFRIMAKMPRIEVEEVSTLNFKDRGGFGSTGRQ